MRLLLLFLILIIPIANAQSNLDLKEANVIDVIFDKQSNDDINYSVTLFHDDDGESGYADAWQIELLNGTVLGIRELLHAHGTVEFTRSSVINTPNTDIVVVRGHDQIHGFGGQAIILNLTSGIKVKIDQGPDKLDFSNYKANDNSTNFSTIIENTTSTSSKSPIEYKSVFFILSLLILTYRFKMTMKN